MNYSFVLVGAVLHLFGSSFYLRDTIRGTTKPNRVSFVLWTILPFIGGGAALSEGVSWAVLPVFMSGVVPFVILLASFFNRQAYWKLHWYDYVLGVLAVLAIILWLLNDSPLLAIGLTIIADALAALPTIIKSWTHPETETGISYAMSLLNALSAFFVLETAGFAEIAFPFYLALQNAVLVFIIYRPKLLQLIKRI